ncbi:unnamed protein product [Gadus morhua 'NCC']
MLCSQVAVLTDDHCVPATRERRPDNTEDMKINLLSLKRSALLPGDSWRQLVARPGCPHWRYLEMLHSNTSLQSAGGAVGQRRARSDCPSGYKPRAGQGGCDGPGGVL